MSVPDPVIVPAYRRPELLWLCLERLRLAEKPRPISVRVVIDNHCNAPPDPDNVRVCKAFADVVDEVVVREPRRYEGNVYNVFGAYRDAFADGPEFIFNVECDIMVATDFFRWHYAVQNLGEWFCSVAVTNLPYAQCLAANPSYWYRTNTFTSWGVCLRSSNVGRFLPYVTNDYFDRRGRYLEEAFPNSRFAGRWHSQDGLISRVMEQTGLNSVGPHRPRAFHAGFYGLKRGELRRPTGTLEQRVAKLREMIRDREGLTLDRKDCEPCPLEAPLWDRLAEAPKE